MYICNNQSSPHLVLFSIIVLFFQFVHGINSDEIDFYPKAGEPHKQKNRRVRYISVDFLAISSWITISVFLNEYLSLTTEN